MGKLFLTAVLFKKNAEKPCKIKAFEACRKISEKFLKLVLTIIGEDDIVYIVAGDTNETKQHRSKDSLQKTLLAECCRTIVFCTTAFKKASFQKLPYKIRPCLYLDK